MSEESTFWGVEKLSKLNHERWFRIMLAQFESRGVTHVLEKTLIEYAAIASPDKCADVDAKVESITEGVSKVTLGKKDNPASSSVTKEKTLNYEKKEKYLKDAGTVKYLLLKGLNDDDQSLLDEYQTPKELWAHLNSKYSKTSKLAAAQY
ncbi:hypothetical protein K3495_g16926, partial [Podosphaera aphanis]